MFSLPALLKLTLSVLLVICLLDMPYGYYQLVRFLGMIGFGWLAYDAGQREQQPWMLFWGASALLINPIFKIALGREMWNIVDVVWAVVLIGSLFLDRQNATIK